MQQLNDAQDFLVRITGRGKIGGGGRCRLVHIRF